MGNAFVLLLFFSNVYTSNRRITSCGGGTVQIYINQIIDLCMYESNEEYSVVKLRETLRRRYPKEDGLGVPGVGIYFSGQRVPIYLYINNQAKCDLKLNAPSWFTGTKMEVVRLDDNNVIGVYSVDLIDQGYRWPFFWLLLPSSLNPGKSVVQASRYDLRMFVGEELREGLYRLKIITDNHETYPECYCKTRIEGGLAHVWIVEPRTKYEKAMALVNKAMELQQAFKKSRDEDTRTDDVVKTLLEARAVDDEAECPMIKLAEVYEEMRQYMKAETIYRILYNKSPSKYETKIERIKRMMNDRQIE